MRPPLLLALAICVVLAAALVLPAAAGTSSRYDPANTGYVPKSVALPLTLLWKHSTDQTTDPVIASPCVGEQMIYSCISKKVYALDRVTGDTKWTYDTGAKLFGTPVLHQGKLYVGGEDSMLSVLNAYTGKVEWQFKLGGPIDCPPLIVGNMLYIGSDDDNLHAIDVTRQGQAWAFGTGGDIKAPPAFSRGNLYAASRDGYLYCIDTNGQLRWRAMLNSGDNFSAPVVDGDKGLVFVASGISLHCFDAMTRSARWAPFRAADLISGSPAMAGDRKLYLGSKDGAVYCVSALDGRALWKYPPGAGTSIEPILSSPTIIDNDTLLARAGPKLVVALNRQTGELKWEYRLATPPERPKAAATGGGGMAPGGLGPGGMAPGGMGPGGMAPGGMGPGGAGPGGMGPGGPRPGGGGGMAPGGGGGMAPGGGGTGGGARGGGGGARGGGLGPGGGPGGGQPGGRGGGGRLGGGGQGEEEKPAELAESLSASLVVADDGAMYIVGDDAAVYAFDASAVDAEPPVISNAVLDVTGKDNYRFLYGLTILGAEAPPKRYADALTIPGRPPIRLYFDAMDEGSGINPASVEMYMDDTKLPSIYDALGGKIWHILDPEQGPARPIADGTHNVVVKARDWGGLLAVAQVSFTVDNNLTLEVKQAQAGGMGPGGMGPGGMGPGGMGPGGAGGGVLDAGAGAGQGGGRGRQ